MDGLIDSVGAYLREHWIELLVAAASAVAGWFFGKRRARAEWRRREFYDRLNVSLSSLVNGKLRIRTLIEKRCEEVFLNRVASETVIKAARQTTEADPFLHLPDDDYWFYLNAVLNEVAEKFAEGTIRRDILGEGNCERYAICLTSEAAGKVRTRKIRAMVVKSSMLDHLSGSQSPVEKSQHSTAKDPADLEAHLPEQQIALESPTHTTRLHTLHQMAIARKTHPHRFIEVEICV